MKYYIFFLNLFLLFSNYVLIYEVYKNKKINDIKNDFNKSYNNNSLYHIYKYNKISILIPNIEDIEFNENCSINNFINSLINQTLNEIQIFFIFSEKGNEYYNITKNFSKFDKRIKIFIRNEKTFMNNIFFLLEKTNGKFIYLINNFELLYYNELEMFYNYTRGKSNHFFKFISNKGNEIYLIKSKILKDLSEEDCEFFNIENIINYVNLLTPHLN